MLIKTARGQTSAVAEALSSMDCFPEVFSVAGRYDLVAVLRVRSNEEMAEIVTTQLSRVEGIVDTETMAALRAYSRRDLENVFGD